MIVESGKIRKRLGYDQLGSNLPLAGAGAQLIEYIDARGIKHTIAVTTAHAYEYQGASDVWLQITPSIDLDDCETGWTGGSNVTLSHDSTKIRGSYSAKCTLTAEHSDGDQIAYKDISSTDISSMTHIGFWIRADANLAADDLEIVISESNHASGEKTGTYVECLTTALTADTWTFVCLSKTLTSFDAVISCSIYANATIANGTVIYLDDIRGYDEFAGDETKRVTWALATDINEFTNNGGLALIMSNGVDDLFYYEGHSGDVFQTLVHAYPSFANCVEIAEFWNHFMLINFNTGSSNVRSVAYADLGDIDDWTAGTSGLSYLTDSVGKILRAVKLNFDMVLYSEKSITNGRYHGGITPFTFPTVIQRTGVFTHSSIIPLTIAHLFLGTDQRIYEYRGGIQIRPIGMNIESSLFKELDNSKKAHIVCGYDENADRAYFTFPQVGDSYSKAAYCLNRKQPEQPWEYFEFADDIRGFVMHENAFGWYCDDSQFVGVYADEIALYCDQAITAVEYPVITTIDSNGYVFKHNESFGKDDDADITCEYQTQDVSVDKDHNFGEWEWLTFTARSLIAGGTVSAYYSSDSGDSWAEFDDSPCTLTSAWQTFRLSFDVESRIMRVKLRQSSSADLQIKDSIHLEVIPKGPKS
jgi:hypothetical protein